jgi:peptidoglycan/xylan/chitin deacetylase (PgdA/CDA1 family)
MTQLKALEAAGNEIGGHTKTHADLATLNAAAQTTEACGGRTDLITDGFQAPVSFAYPNGSFNASAETVVKSCGFNNARTVADGPESIPPAVPMATTAMPSVQAVANATDPAVTVANMKSWVTGAETGNNKWVQVVWHDILAAPPSSATADDVYYQLTPDFTAFLTWLKGEVTAGRVVVKTAGEAMGGGAAGN